ncbi:MAG: hypothetical protein ICV83_01455 [Cytophagales bacterium]|nr:hypothetical protein [Cytophagales bacterium]
MHTLLVLLVLYTRLFAPVVAAEGPPGSRFIHQKAARSKAVAPVRSAPAPAEPCAATGTILWEFRDGRPSFEANPAHKVKLASVTGFTNSREWNKYPSQKSVLIPWQAGNKYYTEALCKEATGGDNLAVGWQLPDTA